MRSHAMCGVGRCAHVASATDLCKAPVRHDERGIVDGRSAIAVDEPRAFVDGGTDRTLPLNAALKGSRDEEHSDSERNVG